MRNQLLLSFLFFATFLSGQAKFVSGYYINSNNEKKEILIKDQEWYNSPSEFSYKMTADASEQKGTVKNVKEFSIDGIAKYVAFSGNVDSSPNEVSDASFSYKRQPEWQNVEVFLEKISEGKIPLYIYKGKGVTRFYYQDENEEFVPLVYKKYYLENSTSKIGENNQYQEQLRNLLKTTITDEEINASRYNAKSLTKLFSKYNGTENNSLANKKKFDFNFSIRPGINFTNLSIDDNDFNAKFASKASFRIGAEVEIVLPYNNGKWAAIFEPNFSTYEGTAVSDMGKVTLETSLSMIEIPVGLRYYIPVSDEGKFFVNALLVVTSVVGGDKGIHFERSVGDITSYKDKIDISGAGANPIIGVGFQYADKFTVEGRFSLKRNLEFSNLKGVGNYDYASLIVGYKLF